MKVGVFFTAGEGAVDIADVARAAEAQGFGSLWVGEHVVMPVDYERVYPGSESGEAPVFRRSCSPRPSSHWREPRP